MSVVAALAASSLSTLPSAIERDLLPSALAGFASDESGKPGVTPLAIVRPVSAAEVQSVVQWANAHGIPLVPVSSAAGPRRRGDTVSQRPAVIVDLSRMNKILHIDAKNAIAIIEAGVTFADFNNALRSHGLRSFQPLNPRASKSVLAAFLEREPITIPGKHWDITDPLAAMELVFGNGELLRTGGAALPGTLEENLARGNRQMVGSGPMHTDFGRVLQGAQGALGIVTWASIYCERLPHQALHLTGTADTLEPVMELSYRLLRRRSSGQLFILNHVQLAMLLADSAAEFASMKATLPRWTLYVELTATKYFPADALAFQRADLERDAAELGVTLSDRIATHSASMVAARQRHFSDVPDHQRVGSACEEIFCLSQLHRVPGHLNAISHLAGLPELAVYLQPMTHGVNAHCAFRLLGAASERATLTKRAVQTAQCLADDGGFFSRPCYPWAQVPFERDRTMRGLLARTKSMLDPHHILQPHAQSLGESP